MTAKLVLILALCALPGTASADMLHILDSGTVNFHPSSSTFADSYHHVTYSHSAIPGSGWDFGFGFTRSSATFQWVVNVTVEIDTEKAGHLHNDPPPRLFYYPNWPDKSTVSRLDGTTVRSPQLAQDQYFYVHMAPVSFAAALKVLGTFTKSSPGTPLNPTLTHFLNIRTPGIGPMPPNDQLYRFSGATAAHRENHYGSAVTIDALTDLAAKWKNAHPSSPPIGIGNISLPWGGALDVKSKWEADNMHHAYGIAADIGKGNLTGEERAALIKLTCGSGFYVFNRVEGGTELYHAVHREEFRTLKKLDWPAMLPTKADRAVNCCAAKADSPDWRKCVDLPPTRK